MTLKLYAFLLIYFNSQLSKGKYCSFTLSSDWGPGEFWVCIPSDLLKNMSPWDGNKMHVSSVKYV